MNANRDSEQYSSIEDAMKSLKKRKEEEAQRYLKLYGVNPRDNSNYDFVIDSSPIAIDEVVELLVSKIKRDDIKE